MKNIVFQVLFLLFSLLAAGTLFAQAEASDGRLRLDVSARATTHFQLISENEISVPDIEAIRDLTSVYFGSAYRLGASYALNERLHFSFGGEVQVIGFRDEKFPIPDNDVSETQVELRTVDRLLGLGAAFSLRYDLSQRFYLRAGVTPTWVSYRSSKLRVYPEDAMPGLSRETNAPWQADQLRNFNLLLNFGLGYGFPLGAKHRLYLEYGAEYYSMSFLNNSPLNRRILGAALKVGVTF
jgi:hypothetical protein